MNRQRLHYGMMVFLLSLIMSLLTLVDVHTSSAQPFTAKYLGDYGNVTVMEVTGNYDVKNEDGSYNDEPRKIIARELLRTHKDDYDFLVIFTNFDFNTAEKGVVGFYEGVKNDTRGIGQDPFDYTGVYGSNGKLQGTIDMGNINNIVADPLNPKFEEVLITLSHEFLHRWAAHVKITDASGVVSRDLLGDEGVHWSFLFDTGGSVMYGNKWRNNENGTFTSLSPQSQMNVYSSLDLYLMGMIDKSKVPPMVLIDSPDLDPSQLPQSGVTVSGTAHTVTIDDIIAANGPRSPDASTSQKSFKAAFIFATQFGTFTGNELYGIENIRNAWITRHSILTDGKSIVEAAPTLKDDVPVNPGVLPPTTTPRIPQPNVEDGVRWLMSNQTSDGCWADFRQTTERDTAITALSMKSFSSAQLNYQNAVQWLGSLEPGNVDFLSRRIAALAGSGQDMTSIVIDLMSRRNSDGGWGSDKNYASNSTDTALALKALFASGYADQTVISKAIAYLKAQQNADGGWGSEDKGGMVQETSNVLSAFNAYRTMFQLEDAISRGTTWLIGKQNSDGGFGNSPSTVYDTAVATMTLRELNASTDVTNKTLAYLLGRQSENGSWHNSAYQTALAVSAVYRATVDPDLAVTTDDITIIPEKISSLPSNIVLNANIKNLGQTGAQAKVVLYEGSVAETNKIGEQTLAFTGQATTTVTFLATARDGNEHVFSIVVDPDNQVKESNELNNTAAKVLYPEATYDFEVLSQDILVSANPVNLLQDVTVTAKITNKGTMNAYNVRVKYYLDDPVSPYEMATQTVDIPAGTTITNQTTWRAVKTGANLPLAVFIDPFNSFTEISKTNNKASTTITVNADTRPNLTVSYGDIIITPNPVRQSGNVNISTLVKNAGFSAASDIVVSFFRSSPGQNSLPLGTQTIPVLGSGESARTSVDWANIPESGEKIIYVQVDPGNSIPEIREDDNDAFSPLNILSLPDFVVSSNSIALSSSAPEEGAPVTITATVQNRGDQAASDVVVRFLEDGAVLSNQIIPILAGNSTGTVSLIYDTTGRKGAHTIVLNVDPENAIPELSKDNNSVSRIFAVQDSNLWVTDQYISPNGDGVKDATQFFFRLNAAQSVKVTVVDENGVIVRTFAGTELENTTSGAVTWNGMNDQGVVVADGQYHIQVIDGNNIVLTKVVVVVDNNRSPITTALQTGKYINSNITCNLPDFDTSTWRWFPDESGLFVDISATNQNTPGYSPGFYFITPDGMDVLRIAPAQWTSGDSTSNYDYFYGINELSPDGEKVAFVIQKKNKNTNSLESQLWIIDREGENSKIIDLYSNAADSNYIVKLKWTPDGRHLAYEVYKGTLNSLSVVSDLWVSTPDGSDRRLIDSNVQLGDWLKSSPDGSRFAYDVYSRPSDYVFNETIRVTDQAGNKTDSFEFQDIWGINYFEWLDTQRIVASAQNNHDSERPLWIIDATGAGNHYRLTNLACDSDLACNSMIRFSPDRKAVAFRVMRGSYINLATATIRDNTVEIYERWPKEVPNTSFAGDFFWLPDSGKIALFEDTRERLGNLVLIDAATKKEEVQHLSSYPSCYLSNELSDDLVALLSDGVSLLGRRCDRTDSSASGAGLYLIDTSNGGVKRVDSVSGSSSPWLYFQFARVSPKEHSVAYLQLASGTSECYGKGYYDLYTTNSLLNLNAILFSKKESNSISLKGTASDLNFEGWRLEYSSFDQPESWISIVSQSDQPVINDTFTNWVPPATGIYNVKLTVWDKAGNLAMSRKKVTWGQASSITNLYKSLDSLSPNGDGVKDTVELHYTVREPVHLTFNIYDSSGNLVKTVYKDYPAAGSDYMIWDGKDDAENTVPDGKYSIRVFDNEFFVSVDTTPPQAALSMGAVRKDVITNKLFLELTGHAVDENLKSWVIEYGTGDNPDQWEEYLRGETELAKKNERGSPLNPIQDVRVATFDENDLKFLVGKKLKITVEDFAGNKSTTLSDFVTEMIYLDRYAGPDGNMKILSESLLQSVLVDIAGTGSHTAGGLNTIRTPLISLNAQYRRDEQWYDASPSVQNPSPGIVLATWTNQEGPVNAVRMKAVDIQGKAYYSNTLVTGALFQVDACRMEGANYLFEDLKSVRLQLQSDGDTRYSQWTDFMVFDAGRGDQIPVGTFPLLPPDLRPETKYSFKMTGTGVTGTIYVAEDQYPSSCAQKARLEMSVDVVPREAECGLTSTGAALSSRLNGFASISLKTLSYYIEKPSSRELLRQFDLSREGWGSVAVNTTTLQEGAYPIEAVATYIDYSDNLTKEASASGTLIVDRTPPSAEVNYPGTSAMLCPVKIASANGDWFGVSVEGKAADNNQVKKYELYYGTGENPSAWLPAMTRSGGSSKPISVNGPATGQLGTWDITNIMQSALSLRLKVVDIAGNASCTTTSFAIDTQTEITNLITDKTLFSPNSDGALDDVTTSYSINEYATTGAKVYRLVKVSGSEILDSLPVRTIVSGVQHLGGTGSATWNGKDDSGTVATDERYAITVSAIDSCGNTAQKWTPVEVDNTRPAASISYPRPGDPLGNIVEVRGTADDLHFQSFTLEAGQDDAPSSWSPIASGSVHVTDGILGKWNTYGLTGKWTLRLSVRDAIGNKNEAIVSIDLGIRQSLIKYLDVTPKLFSPNRDGKLDTAEVTYELTDVCDVKIDILDSNGVVRWTFTAPSVPAGSHSQVWDGKDGAGTTVADSLYNIRLTTALSANTSVTQAEAASVTIDSTPPAVDIAIPSNNAFLKTNVTVNGSIIDPNLKEYSLAYSNDAGIMSTVDQGNQSRSNYIFGTLADLAEGAYTLKVKSKDLAENSTERTVAFAIDRTPPAVKLDNPKNGAYYGGDKSIVDITGSIAEKNLDTYHVRYGQGDSPTQWMDLSTGSEVPSNSQLFMWNIDQIPDGLYTLSLFARDKAGSEAETRVKVSVDNTPPEAAITVPGEGGYIRTATDFIGTASDQNLDYYMLELSAGRCDAANKWALIKKATVSLRNNSLSRIEALPADGEYCIRLTVVDKPGNKTEAKVNINVDTHPPASPVLSGQIKDKTNAQLTWVRNTEPDIAGYNIYRDGQKVNVAPVPDLSYLDQNLRDGIYAYALKAVDLAGGESVASNEVKLTIDITGPDARIRSPQDNAMAGGVIDIKGTAYSADDFKQYRLYVGQGTSPSVWTLIRTSPVPVTYGSLEQWDTAGLTEGQSYSIKLETEDLLGNINSHQITIRINSMPPQSPSLVSVTRTNSDITATWSPNPEADLAGYLLYRNDQPVNSPNFAIGDPKPYLITGTSYIDKALPDGLFTYYVVAVDLAGNMSEPSNSIAVNVDVRAPRASIIEPADHLQFENTILVKAESPDLDVASIQFQIKKSTDSTWTNMGAAVSTQQFKTSLAPVALNLTYGTYNLRALATDKGGRSDPSPPVISVAYSDFTAPSAPQGLRFHVEGGTITLIWNGNGESDLGGYNVYRASGSIWTKINTVLVTSAAFQDGNLSDGVYAYRVTAVDKSNNESGPTEPVSASVYTPILEQTTSPTAQSTITLKGSNGGANTTISVYVEDASGTTMRGSTVVDPLGEFSADVTLAYGESKVTVRATDGTDNVSKVSNTVTVLYHEPPQPPTGLSATVSNRDVQLTWNANAEPDLIGYNLYRNGSRVNKETAITAGTVTASSVFYNSETYDPSKAIDTDPYSYWMPETYPDDTFKPAWLEMDLPSPEYIGGIRIFWNYWYGVGKDYEVQTLCNDEWVSVAEVKNNSERYNALPCAFSCKTSKIRLNITGSSDNNSAPLSEIRIVKETPISQTQAQQIDLRNGVYKYRVTAIDKYGMESFPSNEEEARVGNVAAPAAPTVLTAVVNNKTVSLSWNPNVESDLSGYNIYRDGRKINSSARVTEGIISASSTISSFFSSSNVFDSNPSTFWISDSRYVELDPAWVEIDMPASELINHAEINWGYCAGKDFEIQFWSGTDWIPQVKVSGNIDKVNVFDVTPSCRTAKIRLYVTSAADPQCNLQMSEIVLLKDVLNGETTYHEEVIRDGNYAYTITAVNNDGLESVPSDALPVQVGDMIPPAAPQNLIAEVSNSNIVLAWSLNTESDFAGYNIYKKINDAWVKLNAALVTGNSYTDPNLKNGLYSYRVTAIDTGWNESQPSETQTIVNVLPLPPFNVTLIAAPEGRALNMQWDYVSGSTVKYNIYRSAVPGGPYAKINGILLTTNSYADTGLSNGIAYYYVLTAVDSLGNEGAYSAEAIGVPLDIVIAKPNIYYPTISGMPLTVFNGKTDIAGSAEAGSSVEIFLNNVSMQKVTARAQDEYAIISLPGYSGNGLDITGNGEKAVYSDSSSRIRIVDLKTGVAIDPLQAGTAPKWSPDGKRFLYAASGRLHVYDVDAMSVSPLTGGSYSESGGSWSPNGQSIAFSTNRNGSNEIWTKNLITGDLVRITFGGYAINPKWSPDGMNIAYQGSSSRRLINLETGTTTEIDSGTSNYASAYEWSPDGKRILYITDGGYAWILDLTTQVKMKATTEWLASRPVWSPDGEGILVASYDAMLGKYSLTAIIIATHEKTVITPNGLNASLTNLLWTKSGRIAYSEPDAVNLVDLKGHFRVSDLRLIPEENGITALAKDESGNTSTASDSIDIVYNTSLLPDAEVSADDIYLYPSLPVAGEQMAINITVRNRGQVEAKDVNVEVYMWNAAGKLELLSSERISSMTAGSAELVSAVWDSAGMTGQNRLVVVIDADDTLSESDESNNMAIRDFIVSDHAGITMTAAMDASQYGSNQNVVATVFLWNNTDRKDVALSAQIEDENGYVVTAFGTINTSIPYGQEQSYPFTWNTGSSYVGTYQVRSILTDTTGVVSENMMTFTVVPDTDIELNVSTDKTAYGPSENVVTSFTIKNAGMNYIIPAYRTTVTITNAEGAVLFSEVKTTPNLLPGSSIDLSSSWDTGLTAPGNYTSTVTVSSDVVSTLTKSVSFTIIPLLELTGTMTASPPIVSAGNDAQISYVLTNTGNTDAMGYIVGISIIDPETQIITQTWEQAVDIAQNSTKSGQVTMSTAGYALKTYTALLQLLSQDTTKNIASVSFAVKDLTPPVVTILSPQTGDICHSTITLSARAVDNVSSVDKVEYRIDGGQWNMLSPADTTTGRYTTTWNVSSADNGSHVVIFRATDKAGNISIPITVDFTVRTALPPAGSIVINGGEQYANNSAVTLALSCTSTTSVCAQMSFSNDAATWSAPESYVTTKAWQLAPRDGLKNVYVKYTDAGGITSVAYLASITLDTAAPVLTLSMLPDGSYTSNATLNIAGTATDDIAVKGVTINGAPVAVNSDGTFSEAVTLVTGKNTVTIITTDSAGNSTDDVRTITLDQTVPVITITAPPDNGITNESQTVVTGTTDETTAVNITVNDGTPLWADVTTAGFSLPVSMAYGQNTIQIIATDLAGNIGAVKRTVTFDDQRPSLAVTYPAEDMSTEQSQITVAGEVSDLTAVTVTVTVDGNDFTPAVVSGKFEQLITFTGGPKTYRLIVTAVDLAGNQSLVQRNVIFSNTQNKIGVFGAAGVSISSGYVDSYDSSKGAYSGIHGSNVSIGTNSTAKGAINLSGGATIYGDVFVGPGGDPSKTITTSGGAVIYGSQRALTLPKDMTPISDPGGGTPVSFKNGTALTSGTYRVSSVNLSGNGISTINGNVTLYVTRSLSLSGGAQIVILPGGSLTVYLGGKLSVSGGAIVNETFNPHNLIVYGTSTCTTVSYSGNSDFYGTLYAPAARTSISSGSVYGSIIGGSVSISGGAAVHYDESL